MRISDWSSDVCSSDLGSFTPLRQRVDIPQLVIDPFGERRAGQIGGVRCRFADGLDAPELDEGRYTNRRRWQIDLRPISDAPRLNGQRTGCRQFALPGPFAMPFGIPAFGWRVTLRPSACVGPSKIGRAHV